MRRANQGFTLIEVMLFLAVSSSLLMIAFMGVGTRQDQVEFRDAVRSLESSLRRDYASLRLGLGGNTLNKHCSSNPLGPVLTPPVSGGSTRGTNEACVSLGKIYVFSNDSSTIVTYPIVGERLSDAELDTYMNEEATFDAQNPLVDQDSSSTTIRWNVRAQPSGQMAIALVKGSKTARIIPVVLQSPGSDLSNVGSIRAKLRNGTQRTFDQNPVELGLSDGSRTARIIIENENIRAEFD